MDVRASYSMRIYKRGRTRVLGVVVDSCVSWRCAAAEADDELVLLQTLNYTYTNSSSSSIVLYVRIVVVLRAYVLHSCVVAS